MSDSPLFVITLDTEPDNEWGRPRVATTKNARFVPRFDELCRRHRLKVTYLLTIEMAEDTFLQEYLRPRRSAGECEVGAHLHPWNTAPLVPATDDDLRYHPYPFEYPVEVQRAKLQTLVDAIERHYGVRPVSYKAGRWGLDGAHAALLDEMGFRADTSVCPGVNWGPSKGDPRGKGGPNFSTAPVRPYALSSQRRLPPRLAAGTRAVADDRLLQRPRPVRSRRARAVPQRAPGASRLRSPPPRLSVAASLSAHDGRAPAARRGPGAGG